MAPPVVVGANVMQYCAHRHRRCPHCIGAARHCRVIFSIHDKGDLMARRFMAAAAVGAMLLVACGSDKKTSTTAAPATTPGGTTAPAGTSAPAETSAAATTPSPNAT